MTIPEQLFTYTTYHPTAHPYSSTRHSACVRDGTYYEVTTITTRAYASCITVRVKL